MSADHGPQAAADRQSLMVSGALTELIDEQAALTLLHDRFRSPKPIPLGVASINLDHVHHFGTRGVWGDTLGRRIEWLNLIDGAPIATKARRLTGQTWPRLAGSDLIAPILDMAAEEGIRVGFLGGSEETLELLRAAVARHWPDLMVSGTWSPSRAQITDPRQSMALAEQVQHTQTDLLVVGLGKPRQELWIENYAPTTGAKVLLAFGAVVDFLAGRVSRAPQAISDAGLEWAWRLALEPRRLARRYLVQGPPAYLQVQRSGLIPAGRPSRPLDRDTVDPRLRSGAPSFDGNAAFVTGDQTAALSAVIVTYNSADDIAGLIESLRVQARQLALRVIVADNGSTDGTLDRLAAHRDITVIETGRNLGYAGGINVALKSVPAAEHVAILNPDLTVDDGALFALANRLARPGVGIAAPTIRDESGQIFPSIRREPTLARALGDAVLGSRLPTRSPRWSETDQDLAHYAYPHPIDWASGAALLLHCDVVATVGDWDDDYFLFMEEVDYQRRVRESGYEIWFEPAATVRHRQGGSGTSSALIALMACNRVRYAEKHGSKLRAGCFRAIVGLHELVRSKEERHRIAFATVIERDRWRDLPRADRQLSLTRAGGTVIIPAHNEASVIARTLGSLGDLLDDPAIEIIVISNGSSDATLAIASSVPGVRAVEISQASKTAALNEGDRIATGWPRLYLDADIDIGATAVRDVFSALSTGNVGGRALEAARPASTAQLQGASWIVRSYYRARGRMPGLDRSLWGAGAYAVNEAGHRRFERFPDVTGDDLFVDRLFPEETKAVVDTEPVVVRMPRSLSGLLAIQRRGARVSGQLDGPSTAGGTVRELVSTVRGPRSALDACIYCAIAVAGRLQFGLHGNRRPAVGWERDESSR